MNALTSWFTTSLDTAIYAVAPVWGSQRIAARAQLATAQQIAAEIVKQERIRTERTYSHHEGASHDRDNAHTWLASELSPDSGLETDLETLRSRSAELVRDDGYAAGAIEGVVNDIIGAGITVQSRIRKGPGVSAAEARAMRNALERSFELWSRACGADGSSFWEIQRRAVINWLIEGEAFLLFSEDPVFGLVIEQIAANRVETPPHLAGNRNVRMGIETNATGRPIRYYIRTDRPDDTNTVKTTWFPVEAARMVHLFDKREDGQRRGKPWFTPVLNRIKNVHDLTHAEVVAMKVASCFAAFVTTDNAGMAAAGARGITNAGRTERIQPGMIKYLSTKEDIKFGTPSNRAGAFAPAHEILMRGVCAGLNYPYEKFVKDWSQLTYSGGRLALIEAWITVLCRQQLVIGRFCRGAWNRHVDNQVLTGKTPVNLRAYAADPLPFQEHKWFAPGMPWVDPKADVDSSAMAVEKDLSSLDDELGLKGKDVVDVQWRNAKNAARKQKMLKKLGVADPNAPPPAEPPSPAAAPGPGKPAGKPKGARPPAREPKAKKEPPSDPEEDPEPARLARGLCLEAEREVPPVRLVAEGAESLGYNPDQPRGADGRWGSGSSGAAKKKGPWSERTKEEHDEYVSAQKQRVDAMRPRKDELAAKLKAGTATPEEKAEYYDTVERIQIGSSMIRDAKEGFYRDENHWSNQPQDKRVAAFAEALDKSPELDAKADAILAAKTAPDAEKLRAAEQRFRDNVAYSRSLGMTEKETTTVERWHIAEYQAEVEDIESGRDALTQAIAAENPLRGEYALKTDLGDTPHGADRAIAFTESLTEVTGPGDQVSLTVDRLVDGDRAHVENATNTMRLGLNSPVESGVHEMGHVLEQQLPGVAESSQAFVKSRIGEAPAVSLAERFPEQGFDAGEMGRNAGFEKTFPDESTGYYAGKVYNRGNTEVLALGLQEMYRDPAGFIERDRQYAKFVIGQLDGSLRAQTKSVISTFLAEPGRGLYDPPK